MTLFSSFRKKALAMFIFVGLVFSIGSASVFADEVPVALSGKEDYSVVHVLSIRSGAIRKYIYTDLIVGIRKLDPLLKLGQIFISYDKVSDKLFSQYDTVVVHSTRRQDTLDPDIEAFLQRNAKRTNLFVVAYLPKNKSNLSSPPKYVDVISSSSKKESAEALVISELAPRVYRQLKQSKE